MNKQAPSPARIFTMLAFAGSCIGLLIFLWISFGGATPFAPLGYRVNAQFNQAILLGAQSDVRISGVSVGKVESVGLDKKTGLTNAVIQIDARFAPLPSNTRAILRAKSLLGETYVQLTPGNRNGPHIPDGGVIPQTSVSPTVQLDQILSTFDPKTRRDFQIWQQQQGIALTGRGQQLNAAIAQLFPFATNVDRVLSVLNRDSAATSTFLHDTGVVFSSLSASPSQLQAFVRNSNATFAATAAQNVALANTIRAFPPFLIQARSTLHRLTQFAQTTKPLIDEFRPAARQLSPALEKTVTLAPELLRLMESLGPEPRPGLVAAAKTGIPALEKFLNQLTPFLARSKPYLGGLIPVIDYVNTYRREVAAFFGNGTAATQATGSNLAQTTTLHYLRIANPVNPEVVSSYQSRLDSNRGAPYMAVGGFNSLLTGLHVFSPNLCTSNPQPTIGPTISADLVTALQQAYYTVNPAGPPCKSQPPLGTLLPPPLTQAQTFPHLQAIP
ncbi:MAG TPA: MlaD family protein [Solirubrobacteraceae bacterium]|jgi:virulence factor Mce-like protein